MNFIKTGSITYWRAISALFAGSFVTFAILYSTQPLIPAFSDYFQITPAYASMSLSMTTGSLAIFMLIASCLSDAKGRKLIMTFALLFSAILAIMTAFTTDFIHLLIIRALQGIALAGFPAIAMVYINEEFHPSSIGIVMGIYVSGTSVGGMTGRIVIGALTDFFSWHIALGIIGVISLIATLWFWFNLPNSRNFTPKQQSLPNLISTLWGCMKEPGLILLYSIAFLIMGSFVTLYNYIAYPLMAPPYNLSHTFVGFIFIIYLVGTFSSTWMGRLADKMGKPTILLLAIIIMFIGGLITLNTSLYLIIIGISIFTFGFFGSHSVASSWVGQLATTNKAKASALYLLFYYAGSSFMGTLGGVLWKYYHWNGIILLISTLLTLSLLLAVRIMSFENQRVPAK